MAAFPESGQSEGKECRYLNVRIGPEAVTPQFGGLVAQFDRSWQLSMLADFWCLPNLELD